MTELNEQIRQLKDELINYKLSKSFNRFIANKKQELISCLESVVNDYNSLIEKHENEIKRLKEKHETDCIKRELCAYYYGAGIIEINNFIRKPITEVVKAVNDHRQKPFLFHNYSPMKSIKISNKPIYTAHELGIK